MKFYNVCKVGGNFGYRVRNAVRLLDVSLQTHDFRRLRPLTLIRGPGAIPLQPLGLQPRPPNPPSHFQKSCIRY